MVLFSVIVSLSLYSNATSDMPSQSMKQVQFTLTVTAHWLIAFTCAVIFFYYNVKALCQKVSDTEPAPVISPGTVSDSETNEAIV